MSRVRAIVGTMVAVGLATAAQPAWAHVEAETTATGGDGTSTIAVRFEHGCDGAATTGLRVALPAGATVAGTEEPEGWSATVQPTEIAWTGTPIDDHTSGSFVAVVSHDAAAGEVVRFPTVQQCGADELAWIDSDPSASNPAPAVLWTVVGEEGVVETAASQPHSHSSASTIALAIGGAIVLALAAVAIYVLVRRRSQSPGEA
jgi:uncharacterized protein YcnI